MASGRKISLWLVPEGEAGARLRALIDRLALRHGTPAFEPHLTLLGGLEGPEAETRPPAGEVAARLRPFLVRLGALRHRDEYYRSLFAEAQKSPELLSARRAAEEAFGRAPDPHFLPHVSLLYGDVPASAKEALIAEIGPELRVTFRAEALFVVATDGEPADWRPVARQPLG